MLLKLPCPNQKVKVTDSTLKTNMIIYIVISDSLFMGAWQICLSELNLESGRLHAAQTMCPNQK